ncbi:unnamed protein product [Brugia pahangi]|uniref:G_PROTEIN_RECEP_F1_2 domain-containing protein n=1 Tax=Brugia pahangi TaxID=6280 RepID=A0A0N4TMG3_BRUPA|nr:unnamed protein product [Brugia pahangi]
MLCLITEKTGLIGMNDDKLIIIIPDVIFNLSKHIDNRSLEFKYRNETKILINLIALLFYLTSILLNCYLLCLNIKCVDYRRYKRLPLLIINFAISNIILAIGFLSYTLFIDIYYQTEIIANSNKKDSDGLTDTTILKEMLKYQIVHNFGNIQALFLLFLATDSYFSLFIEYNPNHQSLIIVTILLSLPYIISILLIDMRFLHLLILILVPSLSFLLALCFMIRQCQMKTFRVHNRSLKMALLIINFFQLIEKWGLAVELFEANFHIVIVVDNNNDNYYLRIILNNLYEIAHGLTLLMPFLSALILISLVRSYRERTIQHFQQLLRWICCKEVEDKIDYNVETMHSIIAGQIRQRQLFNNYSSNIEIF